MLERSVGASEHTEWLLYRCQFWSLHVVVSSVSCCVWVVVLWVVVLRLLGTQQDLFRTSRGTVIYPLSELINISPVPSTGELGSRLLRLTQKTGEQKYHVKDLVPHVWNHYFTCFSSATTRGQWGVGQCRLLTWGEMRPPAVSCLGGAPGYWNGVVRREAALPAGSSVVFVWGGVG